MSDLINNMDHMRISGTKPSSEISEITQRHYKIDRLHDNYDLLRDGMLARQQSSNLCGWLI